MGVPQDPRRAGRPRSQGRSVGRMGDPQDQRHRPTARRTRPTWSQFLRSQAEAILACDLFTADLPGGTQAHVLAVIEHASRRIRILGVTQHPTGMDHPAGTQPSHGPRRNDRSARYWCVVTPLSRPARRAANHCGPLPPDPRCCTAPAAGPADPDPGGRQPPADAAADRTIRRCLLRTGA